MPNNTSSLDRIQQLKAEITSLEQAAIQELMDSGVKTQNEYFLAGAMDIMVKSGCIFHTAPVFYISCREIPF